MHITLFLIAFVLLLNGFKFIISFYNHHLDSLAYFTAVYFMLWIAMGRIVKIYNIKNMSIIPKKIFGYMVLISEASFLKVILIYLIFLLSILIITLFIGGHSFAGFMILGVVLGLGRYVFIKIIKTTLHINSRVKDE